MTGNHQKKIIEGIFMPFQPFMHRNEPAGLLLGISIMTESFVANVAVGLAFLLIFLISGIHISITAALVSFFIHVSTRHPAREPHGRIMHYGFYGLDSLRDNMIRSF